MKLFFVAAVLAVVAAVNATQVAHVVHPIHKAQPKCSCTMPSSIQNGYESEDTPVFKAEAVEARQVGDPNYTYTVMRVKVVFRGCAPANDVIVVKSPRTSSACGVAFTPGTTYAVTAKLTRSATPLPGLPKHMETYTATSCNYNKPWGSCPYEDKVFLYYNPVRGCNA